MKRLLLMSVLFGALFLFMSNTGCEDQKKPSADKELQAKTEQTMKEANRQVGMPAIVNFQEKKVMKQIYELCDQENLICYAYFFNEFKGELGQYIGKCIGYGLPYSTQFSNPEKLVDGESEMGVTREGNAIQTIPQPEPNGLFKPEGLSATWLLLIDPQTNIPRPVYIEPMIVVSPFPLHHLEN